MLPKRVKLCIKAGLQVPQETSCHPRPPAAWEVDKPDSSAASNKVAESFIVCYGRRRGNNAEHEIQ